VRRIIYTTNAIEALRRAVRTRGHFPSDDAATKLLYLVLNHAAAEWKRPPREWAEAKTQFRCHVQRALRERMTDNRPHTKIPTVPMLSDNGSPYIARETRIFAAQLGLKPCFTPVRSPQSNGISEAFVNTLKRDYVRVTPIPNAKIAMQAIAGWFEDYNEITRTRV
jgi:transposase InsO family protein